MSLTGTVKSYNPHKGWGFIECSGQDYFLNKKELKGFCVNKGDGVTFTGATGEKGSQATNVTVVVKPEDAFYFGEIKSFNMMKGFGFITCEAFPGQDVFVLKSELPGGFGPEGGHCKFKATVEEKGPSAKEVQLLGAAGDQAQMMKAMMGGYGSWGWGKGRGRSGPYGNSDDKECWDFKKNGTCPRGAECKFTPCCDNNKS
eukprot:TRINITY_DN30148_c0_g1_i1.p1 TRINITY_DN30148_c0_g1~~TRINITY_DN30148_c0_g1_i1.p1  ORF type:complete len:201 (-),score=49.98 TRINITY_DN30148_c0_g1_i1:47-649(-)